MSYPNNLTYPQAKAGLYAGSNCFIPIYVNKNPRPYIPVPSLGELLCFQQVPEVYVSPDNIVKSVLIM